MAGLRVGFLIAHPETIRSLSANYFGNSNFCVSALSIIAAQASLKDPDHCKASKEKNEAARNYTIKALQELGYKPVPSYTNFIYFNLKDYPGDFAKDMLTKNIILRSSEQPDGKYCRVSVGTMEEMKSFIKEIKK
jgi:histidinol-phosphate aminotransferase